MVASYATAVIQVPSLIWRNAVLLIINCVLYCFQLGASVVLAIAIVDRITLPEHYAIILVVLSLATAVFMGMSGVLLFIPRAVAQDLESFDTCSVQLTLNKTHLTLPPPHLDLDQKTITASVHKSEDEVGWLVRASMNSSALHDNGTENWMDTRPLRHAQSSPMFPEDLLKPEPISDDEAVRRSKSTSQLQVARVRKRQQRWQLIHDEKVFIQGVSENLLPSLLKPGVSSIQLQRKAILEEGRVEDRQFIRHPNLESLVNMPTQLHGLHSLQSLEAQSLQNLQNLQNLQDHRISQDQHSRITHSFHHSSQLALTALDEYALEGLEEMPEAQIWGEQTGNVRNVSLQEWEKNNAHWVPGNAHPIVVSMDNDDKHMSARSMSAPSLYTFRQVSDTQTEPHPELASFGSLENTLTHCVTPTQPPTESMNSSPIKKMLGMFRRRDSDFEYSHRHTSSVTHSMALHRSTTSGKSTRSSSPKKAIRALLRQERPIPPTAVTMRRPHLLAGFTEEWELDEQLNQSRVSSMPSAVIGEYDKEKWQTLKELERRAAGGAPSTSA